MLFVVTSEVSAHVCGRMDPQQLLNRIRTDIVGMPVTDVWIGYANSIFFDFGRMLPGPVNVRTGKLSRPHGELSLSLEFSWRVESADTVLCGSMNEEQDWKPVFAQIVGLRVVGVEMFGWIPEIAVVLENDIRILSFTTFDGQPNWWFSDNRGKDREHLVVENGKLAVSFN